MKLEQSFAVRAPVDEVWDALIDIERVAPCLPGAEITERDEDGTYRGDFKVKLGPTTAAYRGTLKMETLDQEAHVATMLANGQDKRGQGSAKATIVSRMTESGGVTQVEVETDFTITGKLARFGRGGMIKDISNRLLGDFARCLQAGFEGADGDGAVPATDGSAAPEVTEASEPDPSEAEPAAGTTGGREPTDADADPAAAAPSSESPGGPDAPRVDTGAGARFSPPAASPPISGAGLVGSVLLDRAAPILLPVVRALRRLLERLERALASS